MTETPALAAGQSFGERMALATQARLKGPGAVWAAICLACAACAAHGSGGVEPEEIGPEALLVGQRTRPPQQSYPTELTLTDPYGRTWDATAAVLASRGFPFEVMARDTGVITTGWRITQPNHEVQLAGGSYVGRKVERLSVLVRPVVEGTRVTISSQTVLASPRWSVAAPAAGHAVDIFSDTVTEYGLLHDIARVLGQPPARAPDRAYGAGLSRGGVVAELAAPGGSR